jgi:D-sedoheptulose 7-phosphate isomerase
VPAQETARIQEAHIFLGHVLCALIEKALGVGGWE